MIVSDITASFVITTRGPLFESQRVIEQYTSVTSERNLERMLENLADIIVRETGKRESTQQYTKELTERVVSYSSHLMDPVQLGSNNQFKIDVRIPADYFDIALDGIPHLLVRFAGNIFRTSELEGIKWVDLTFPPGYADRYDWMKPNFGITGIKSHLNIASAENHPLIAATIQPNIGLTTDEFALLSRSVIEWGADLVIEDEILGDISVCPLSERVTKVCQSLEKLKKPSIYLVNITGWSDVIQSDLLKLISSINAQSDKVLCGVLLCPFYSGFATMKNYRTRSKCPIFAHYYSISLFIRNPSFGISTKVLATLASTAGADFVYIGHISGRHIAEAPMVLSYVAKYLRENGIYPAVTGGINAKNIIPNIRYLGLDLLIQSASGIFGHPQGPKAGLKVLREMLDLCQEYCIFCKRETCRNCGFFGNLLGSSPELAVVFQDTLPTPDPCKDFTLAKGQ